MPMGSIVAVSATAPFPWSRERSRVPAGRARGSSVSGGSWILTQARERAMAKADHAPAGLTIRCAGRQPIELTPTRLLRLSKDLPHDWSEQRHVLGFAA